MLFFSRNSFGLFEHPYAWDIGILIKYSTRELVASVARSVALGSIVYTRDVWESLTLALDSENGEQSEATTSLGHVIKIDFLR